MNNMTNGTVPKLTTNIILEYLEVSGPIFAVVELLLMLPIIFGNGLIILSVVKFHYLQTTTNALIVNLAICDLLVGVTIPYHAMFFFNSDLETFKYLCIIRYVFAITFCMASIVNLTFISVDLYVAILYPLHYHRIMTLNIIKAMIIFVWFYSMFLGLLIIPWNTWEKNKFCDFYLMVPIEYNIGFLGNTLLICIAVTLILYLQIFLEAKHQIAQINDQARYIHGGLNILQETKKAKVLFIVIGVFCVSWTPLGILSIISASMNPYQNNPMSKLVINLKYLSAIIGFSNSAMNPLIYAKKNRGFSKAFLLMLRIKTKEIEPENI